MNWVATSLGNKLQWRGQEFLFVGAIAHGSGAKVYQWVQGQSSGRGLGTKQFADIVYRI